MKKIGSRLLSLTLCLMMVVGLLAALPTVFAETANANVFVHMEDSFDSYEAGNLPAGSYYTFPSTVPTVTAEAGRGNVIAINGSGNPVMEVTSPQIDKVMSFDFQYDADNTGSWGGLYVKPYFDGGDSDQVYAIFGNGTGISSLGAHGGIALKSGVYENMKLQSYTFSNTKWYSCKIMLVDKTLSVKVWEAGLNEPTAWTVVGTATEAAVDTQTAPVRIQFVTGDGANCNFKLDNLKIEKVIADNFESYEVGSGVSGAVYTGEKVGSVADGGSGHGKVLSVPNTGAAPSLDILVGQADKEVSFEMLFPSATGENCGLYAKTYFNNDSNDVYTLLSSNVSYGGVSTGIRQACDNTQGNGFGTVKTPVSYEPNTWYSVKLRLDGQEYSTKVWKSSDPEPSEWNATGETVANMTDAGSFVRLQFGWAAVQIDNLLITSPSEKPVDLGPAIPSPLYDGYTDAIDSSSDLTKYAVGDGTVTLTEVDSRQALQVSVPNSSFVAPLFDIAATQVDRLMSFDFKFDPNGVGKWGGLYVKPYYDGDDAKQIYAILSNGSDFTPGISLKSGKAENIAASNSALDNFWYSAKVMLLDNVIAVKAWKADSTEPAAWSVYGTATESTADNAKAPVRFQFVLTDGANTNFYLDNLKIQYFTDPADQTPVKVTAVTNNVTMGTVTVAGTVLEDGFKKGTEVTLTATAKEGYTFLCWKKDGAIVSQSAEYTVTVDGDAAYTAVFDPDVGDPDVVHFEDDYQEYREGLVEKKYMPVQYVGFENGDFYTVEDDNGNMYIEGTATASSPKIYIDCSIVDKEVVFDFCYDGSFAKNYHGGLYVKLLDAKATSGGKNEQYFSINPELSNGKLNISNTIDGKLTQQGTLMSFSEDTWYTVRSRMVNQRVYVKIWKTGTDEPNEWTSICDMSAPVASNADARFYFELHDKGNSVKIKLDNIQINTWEKLAEKNSYTITAAVNDETMGRVVGDGQYYMNNEAALVALPNDGYGFVNWTENGTVISTNSTLTFTVTENRDVVANFEKLQPTIRSFMANGMTAPAVINAADKTITVTFASDINLAAVRPYFYLENWTDTTGVPQPYEIMDLSSGTAEIGDWTVNASQNEVMTVFYVDGSVASSGNGKTAGTAFKTISEAQAAVRAITEWTGDVLVNIADGEYLLDETLTFDSRDSAENNCAVIYRAASDNENGVVISSGHKLTGWTQSDEINGAWEISVPGMAYSRDLYVDGKKAVIARSNGLPGSLSRNDSICGYSASGDLANLYNWRNVDNIEFIYEVSWTYSIIPVASASAGEIRMMESAFKAGRNKPGVQIDVPGYIQNAFELLDQPGEWYFDEDGATIYYYPENGADPNTLDIVIPTLDQLVTVNGTGTDTVDGLAFQGLTFEYTSFIRPQEMGQVEIQANFVVDPDMVESCASMKHDCYEKTTGGVTIAYATGVRVADCTFRHFSASGLDFEEGVVGSTIMGNTFNNISASGIQIGGVSVRDAHPYYSGTYVNGVWNDAAGADPARVTESILILSNDLEKIGVDYKGSVAIFAGYVRDITIAHNRLHDLPYSGISIGWGWGYWDQGCRPDGISMGYHVFEEPTIQARYVVENNHISVTMQRLKDGGGIYSLSLMPGSIIRGNYMHDSKNFFGGIYNDEASGGFVTISDNITTSSVYDPYFYHNVGGYYPDRAAQTEAVMTNNYDQQDSGDAKYDQIKANAGLLDLSNTNVEPDLVNPDQVAAEAVDALIDAIGSVTLNSKDEIDAARAAYDALTDVQKAKVTKLSVLTAAEDKYKELAEEAEQDEIDEAAANVVEEKIDAIGTVTLKSKDAIEAARRAYDALTDAQKALVDNYDELVAAEAALKDLITDAFITGSLIIGSTSHPFDDVKDHWAEDAIAYVYSKGLMNGVEDDKFAPDVTLTRAMVVTILYRLSGEPVTFGTAPFSDVESGSWYGKAVLWASKNNIVNGMGDGSFAPMQNITREQFASILYRYAQYRGEMTGAAANLNGYKDAGQISGWATEAMAWAAAEGLINGRTATTIAPKGTATRAEAATILMRFCKRF